MEKKCEMKIMKICTALFLTIASLLLLVACSDSEESAASDPQETDLQTSEGATQATPYSTAIESSKERLKLVQAADPVDRDALWDIYTGVVELQLYEYTFKGGLYAETESGADEDMEGEGQKLLDSVTELKEEMQEYFSEDIISDWSLQLASSSASYIDLGRQYEVVDTSGNIDVNASWEHYVEERIDLDDVLRLNARYSIDYDGEIISIDLPDGLTFDETGNCTTDVGQFWMYVTATDALQSHINWSSTASNISQDLIENFESQGYYYYPELEGWNGTVTWGPTEGIYLCFETAKDSSPSVTMNLFFIKQGCFYQIGFESFDRDACFDACMEILNSVKVVGYPVEGLDVDFHNMFSHIT